MMNGLVKLMDSSVNKSVENQHTGELICARNT